MGYTVRHIKFGEGLVDNISGKYIEINFNGEKKKFQFPRAFGIYLETDDDRLLQIIKNLEEGNDHSFPRKNNYTSSNKYANKRRQDNEMSYYSVVSLLGTRAQSIVIKNAEDMYEIVGYLAKPGIINSIEAEVPMDRRAKLFESMFPNQKYHSVVLAKTPSGLPNKLSAHFRINLKCIDNCPEILRSNLGKGKSACIARINKSAFVLDLVKNYGFKFGAEQDVTLIREIARRRGYLSAFERGYSR